MNNATTCDVSLIYVHYFTPELIKKSIDAAINELEKSFLDYEILVVDNSNSLNQQQFSNSKVSVISRKRNIGYAAGINFGVASSKGRDIIISNGDVIPQENCLTTLLKGLESFDVTTPNLYLDDEFKFRLPPQEPARFSYFLIRKLSRKYPVFEKLLYLLWRRNVERYWNCEEICAGYDMSGAMMAFSRGTFDLVGKWDEEFFLFYEETDWLLRLKHCGLKAAYFGNAMATHHFSQSVNQISGVDKIFMNSEQVFTRKHFSPTQIRLLDRLVKLGGFSTNKELVENYMVPEKPMWLELSYSRSGCPAARAYIKNPEYYSNGLPDVLTRKLHTNHYYLQWFNSNGKLFSRGKFILK